MFCDLMADVIENIFTVVTPWIAFALLCTIVLGLVSFCRQKRLFAKPIERFNGLPLLHKTGLVVSLCLIALTVVPKDDRSGGGYVPPSPPRALPPELAAQSNLLSVTDFAVDTSNGVVGFEVTWTNSLFDYTYSRNLFLFSSTNLMDGRWTPLGAFPMPLNATSHVFTVTSSDIDVVARPWFMDSLAGIGFYRFGVDLDADGDGLIDSLESWWVHTDPDNPDTDGDGLSDGLEMSLEIGTDPLNPDTDGDGVLDGDEIAAGTSPLSTDSDGDCITDREELGWWEYVEPLPMFDVSGGTNLLSASSSYYASSTFVVPLPFTVRCSGVVHTNMTVGLNGMIGLMAMGRSNSFPVNYLNRDITSYGISDYHVAVAAYWDDLCAVRGGGAQITVADVHTNGDEFCVVQYANMRQNAFSGDPSKTATFQIVIPRTETNVVYVNYVSMSSAFDGSSATIGAQSPKKRRNFPVAFNVSGSVTNGMCIAYHFGTGSDPMDSDTDDDRLSDGEEIIAGTSPILDDTDLDVLPDEWEVVHALDALSGTGGDGPDGDPDGDLLCNLKELQYGTDPQQQDTDGDGLSDAEETGSISLCSELPWLQFDAATNLTTALMASNNRCTTYTLPFSMNVQGEIVTNVTLSYNGLVMLDRAGASNSGMSTSHLSFTMVMRRAALLVAPHLAGFRFYTNIEDRVSAVSLGTATHDGQGYLLAEWKYMYYSLYTSSTNSISFQLAIPTNSADRAYATYGDIIGSNMDGRLASIGIQTFGGGYLHSYCDEEAGKVWDGLQLKFLFGANTDPLNPDMDSDGLLDGLEIVLGTDPCQPDTDGDGMYDGWEYSYGFDPAIHNDATSRTDDDGDADPDEDGLTNEEEADWGTDPRGIDADGDGFADGLDSDGDGVDDGDEVEQSSDPADDTDMGQPNSRVRLSFYFGDHSGSNSEKYRLEFLAVRGVGEQPSARSLLNALYGTCETKSMMFKPGWEYEVRLFHAGTDPAYTGSPRPDYDYTLRNTNDVLPLNVVLEDPESLFGVDDSSETFAAAGKVARIKVYGVVDVAVCNPDGDSWSDLEESRVILDDEQLRIKVTVAPQLQSVAQCRQMFGYSLTVKTSGTCPVGTSVPIPDDATLINSGDKSEIRITKTFAQLRQLGLLPQNDEDGVDEMAWMDMGSMDASQSSNLTDSEAFSSLGYQFRGKATIDATKTLESTPPNSVPSKSFFKAAGCEIISVEYGDMESSRCQILNQADYFYYSGHGHISDGSLQSGPDSFEFTPSLVYNRFGRDMYAFIVSGCSVLAIGKCRYDNFGFKTKLRWQYLTNRGKDSSPGLLWENTGCKVLLGYCWRAPEDSGGAATITTFFTLRIKAGDDVVTAWKVANDCPEGRNACAIDCRTVPHKFWYWHEEEGHSTWTNMIKGTLTWPR